MRLMSRPLVLRPRFPAMGPLRIEIGSGRPGKAKNPASEAVRRETFEDWGRRGRRQTGWWR
jgi:hypothetical protein